MKKRVSFDLFDGEDLDLPIPKVFPMKKKKNIVSLNLFEDLLLEDQQPSLIPQPLPIVEHLLQDQQPPPQPLAMVENLLLVQDQQPPVLIPQPPAMVEHLLIQDQQPTLMPQPLSMVPYSGERMPQKKRKLKVNIVQDEAEPIPEPLLPEILQEIRFNGGTVPIFLYQKRLTDSDSKTDQNRIFLSHNREKVMEFLTQEERQSVEDNQGTVEIIAIDPKGKYYTLHMRRWGTLKMVVLKKEWSKLVKANNLEEGDWVQLWGYRQNSQFYLAFNIKKAAKNVAHVDDASSSNVGGNGSSGGASGSGSGSGPSIVTEERNRR